MTKARSNREDRPRVVNVLQGVTGEQAERVCSLMSNALATTPKDRRVNGLWLSYGPMVGKYAGTYRVVARCNAINRLAGAKELTAYQLTTLRSFVMMAMAVVADLHWDCVGEEILTA